MKKQLKSVVVGTVALWAALKSGMVDVILNDLFGTATAELQVMVARIESVLVNAAPVLLLVGATLALSRKHRWIALEMGAVAVLWILAAHVGVPGLNWSSNGVELAASRLFSGVNR
jgi:hypothetical protein